MILLRLKRNGFQCVNEKKFGIAVPAQIKKTATNAAFLGEGIFTMGYSKKYNVLGGFYENYNSMFPKISVHKVHIFSNKFLCVLYTVFSSIPKNTLNFFIKKSRIMPQILLFLFFPSQEEVWHKHLIRCDSR